MRILIIEDDPGIRQTLVDVLEMNGHEVLAAADGETGLAQVPHRPDLILCDIGLPGLDGYGVIRAIRELPEGKELPFIFLTARAERRDQRLGMALGADDYITKPFTERELIEAIEARVHRQRPLRERVEALVSQQSHVAGARWSHELLTPLIGILGGLELIEAEVESLRPPELRELLQLIRAGAERQHRLARKLILYFELLQSPPVVLKTAELAPVILAEARTAADEAGRANDLDVQCEAGSVRIEPLLVAPVLHEMIENACKFSAPGTPVTVRGTRQEGCYRVVIRDRGCGMTTEQRAAVGPFVQFDRGKREQQGLGLGLAIARLALERCGGALVLDDVPDAAGGLQATLEFAAPGA